MKELTSNYTTKDNLKIFTVEWKVEKPKAIIGFVHGFGEHILRYRHVAKYFGENGIGSLGYDRRGHGQSEGKRGHTPNFEAYMDEISNLVVTAKETYPKKPIFLYGHSMGGNLVLNYVLKRNPKITGVITTGPWIDLPQSSKPSSILLFIAKMMSYVAPSVTQPTGLDASFVSLDKKVVEAYQNDPLVHGEMSVKTATVMNQAANFLNTFKGEFPLPLLNMHASSDKLTDFAASKAFSERVSGKVTFKEWTDWYHEIHNEKGQKEVFDFTLNWMESVIGD